ncbi:hypothetical protein [Actinoplanes sp. N902-109]|uniref:hypothetical protein n=1 Tax=Actinoplanes sp. (strain N902-109) TaxID=649831 RepID=UPI0003295884|nr:hypothetical protein [Actinoplanes sp. N902-109]AGL18293.1 hypothetical protein L083_4783 [Actinoplanes sp. N902-109]
MPLHTGKTPRRIAGLLVASAALVFTVAACGGSDDSSTAAPGRQPGGGTNAFAAYTQCLAQNGVTITMPSGMARNRPSAGASGFPRGNRPSGRPAGQPRPSGSAGPGGFGGRGGFPGGGGFQKPAGVDDATWQKAQSACASLRPSMGAGRGNRGGNGLDAAYTNCLKDHGVTDLSTLNSTDAKVTAAKTACKALAPTATPAATS